MDYRIFLDDIRFPYDAYVYTKDTSYFRLSWVIVRSYDEFVKTITKNGLPSLISFDHDLADEHYHSDDQPWSTEFSIDYFSYKEKTGYECAKWLCDYCLDNNVKLPETKVHSLNQVGGSNIRYYLSNFKKHYPELIINK